MAISRAVGDELAYGDEIAFGDFEVVGVGDRDADGKAARGFVKLGGLFWGRSGRDAAGLLSNGYTANSQ